MRVRRDIASIPVRSAKETWVSIINLITRDNSAGKAQLEAAASIMESLITDETPAITPIVIKGCDPRVHIYCYYNEDAMELGLDIDPLNNNPTAGDWRMTAPCEEEDVAWMNQTLQTRAPRISVHAAGDVPSDSDEPSESAASLDIDWEALNKS